MKPFQKEMVLPSIKKDYQIIFYNLIQSYISSPTIFFDVKATHLPGPKAHPRDASVGCRPV
jgi:hypothetical protein